RGLAVVGDVDHRRHHVVKRPGDLSRDAGEEVGDGVDALVAAEAWAAVPDGVVGEEQAHAHRVVTRVADVGVAGFEDPDGLDRLQACDACVEIVVHGCDHRTPVRTRSVTWDELPVVVTFAPTGTQVTRADNPREGMWWRVSGAHIRSAARNSRRPADSV